MLILIGWMRRPTFLGWKFEECRACGVMGPHLLVRTTHWFTVFRFPVLLLWMKHGLMCPTCGDYQALSFLQVRRALKAGRLALVRNRPGFETASLQRGRAEDLSTFALPAGPSSDALTARWDTLAKEPRPDAGGGPSQLVAQAVPNQLAAPQRPAGNVPTASEVFDPVIKNPKRGFFDGYLKLWAVAAIVLVVITIAVPRSQTSYDRPAGVSGTAHVCWTSATNLEGCQDDTTSTMLFGTRTGTEAVCYFTEPLLEGQSADCTTP